MSDLRALVESGLVDKEDGTIFDVNTKLLWQQSLSNKTFTWEGANEYCKSLTFAGHNDWRLPTKEELEHLINRKYQPTIDPIFKCEFGWYWSSSPGVDSPDGIWGVVFGRRGVYSRYNGHGNFVRAVRG